MMHITSQEFAKAVLIKPYCIFSTGAYEQHGPHCALETDYLIAKAIATHVANDLDIILLPSVPYGISSLHRTFPGTVYITSTTYREYVKDILLSLRSSSINKVFVINGHGGNYSTLVEAANICNSNDFKTEVLNWFDYVGDEIFSYKHRSHAGSMETSVLSYLSAEFIRETLVENMVRNPSYDHKSLSDIRECSLNGVIGIADNWSEDKGEKLFKLVVERIEENILREIYE